MMTSAQAREVLDTVTQKHPERWMATVNTIVIELMEALEAGTAAESETRVLAEQCKKALIRLLNGAKVPAAGAQAAAPAGDAPEPQVAGEEVVVDVPTHGADGSPLPPEQVEAEAAMAAAIAAEKQPARPAGGKRPGGRPRPQAPAPQNGSPQSQDDVEAIMDAAAGPRPS